MPTKQERSYGQGAQGEPIISTPAKPSLGAGGSTGVVLNPSKTSEFVPVAGDSRVVIGNL